MKKKIALSMAAVMMLAFCACGRETVETTAPTIIPTEITIPGTVTQETIASEKLPVEMHPFYDALTASGFQYSRGALEYYTGSTEIGTSDVEFLFTGESNVINLVTMDMTLTLPKDWMDRVAIYQVSANAAKEGSHNGYCYLINRDIIAANWGIEYVTMEDLLGGSTTALRFSPSWIAVWRPIMTSICRYGRLIWRHPQCDDRRAISHVTF